jgi:hypothetical protein
MEYQVPQFIEVEDKLVGPLTLKQFIYVSGGAGACIISFVYLPTVFALLCSAAAIAFAAVLAFYKVNGKSFIEMLEAGFNYYTGAKFFLWKHKDKTVKEQSAAVEAAAATEAAAHPAPGVPRLTRGKLSELAWSLDVQHPNAGSDEPSR